MEAGHFFKENKDPGHLTSFCNSGPTLLGSLIELINIRFPHTYYTWAVRGAERRVRHNDAVLADHYLS